MIAASYQFHRIFFICIFTYYMVVHFVEMRSVVYYRHPGLKESSGHYESLRQKMMFHIIPDSSFNQKHKGIVCLKVLPFRRI